MSDRTSDSGARVYVGGLDNNIKKEDLETEFEKYGKLNNVWVAFNPPGFAFIEFNNVADAENAVDNLNGIDLLGSKLRVELARGKSRRGGFRGGRGRGGAPYGDYREDRGFRGGPGGGGRFEGGGGGFGGVRREDGGGRFGGRDFERRSDGFQNRGAGRGGPPRRFDADKSYRSRSPMGGIPRR
ncbi:RNA-binding protein Rsf1-like [Cylas formicarius]|uniref:RNA-binding protein Rsf1-like n=1 Tax=Cylas formicarius TaxID=197179 RepID=UPI0029584F69|nr:RNA-binding protein Rsf1-like [Cylas formicarius]